MFKVILFGMMFASFAFAEATDPSQVLQWRKPEIAARVKQEADVKGDVDFFIYVPGREVTKENVLLLPQGRACTMIFSAKDRFHVRIELANITLENVNQKIDEAVAIAITEFRVKKEQDTRMRELLTSMTASNKAEVSTLNGAAVKVGSAPYFSAWTEVPVSITNQTGPISSHVWLRTTVTLEGMLQNQQTKELNGVAIARLGSTIWQFREEAQGGAVIAVILGTLEASGSLEPTQGGSTRFDVNVYGVQLVWPLFSIFDVHTFIEPFIAGAGQVGVRFLEQSRSVQKIAGMIEFKVGLLIGQRLFIAAKAGAVGAGPIGDHQPKDQLAMGADTRGFEAGFKASKRVMFRAGVDYSKSEAQRIGHGIYDPMYPVPQGWSFNTGIVVRY